MHMPSPERLTALAVALIVGIVAGVCWRALAPLPATESPLIDARIAAERLLAHAPGVRSVDVLVDADDAKQNIIQVNDAHYVTLADFAREVRETSLASGVKVTDAEIRRLYCDYVDDLLDLRNDQLVFLRWLVDRYRLDCVFFEGLCDDGIAPFREGAVRFNARKPTLFFLADTMRHVPELARHAAEHALTIEEEERAIEILLCDGLYYAAVGRLIIERPKVKVLAPEELVALEEAYAEGIAGKKGEKAKLREAIIVKRLLAHKGCSVIILGEGHDLSNEIRRQSHGRCDYLKLTPARFPTPPLKAVGGSWPLYGGASMWLETE